MMSLYTGFTYVCIFLGIRVATEHRFSCSLCVTVDRNSLLSSNRISFCSWNLVFEIIIIVIGGNIQMKMFASSFSSLSKRIHTNFWYLVLCASFRFIFSSSSHWIWRCIIINCINIKWFLLLIANDTLFGMRRKRIP